MASIFQAYTNALLADATYALGDPAQGDLTGATGDPLAGYLADRLTTSQANYLAANSSQHCAGGV